MSKKAAQKWRNRASLYLRKGGDRTEDGKEYKARFKRRGKFSLAVLEAKR